MVVVKTNTPNLDRIEKETKYLKTHGVKVGVIGNDTNDDGISIKEYANYLIVGTSNMPPRDFMQHSVRNRKGRLEVARLQKQLLRKVYNGEITGEQALNQIGIYVVQMIKASIMSNDFAPLKQSTINKKTRNKNNILRNQDFLLNAINYEIVRI